MFYDRKKLFDGIRKKLATGGSLNQGQVDGISILLAEGERRNFNTEWIAYVLATAWHETGATMLPIRETFAKTDSQAIARLTNAWKKGTLKVSKDYWSGGFFGRGYVQLTHEYNYKKMGDWLGIDLVKKPELAMEPDTAAKIIYEGMLKGMFTGKKLSDYLDGIDGTEEEDLAEYEAARKTVNGKDKAKMIAKYAVKFEDALRAAEGAAPIAPPVEEKKKKKPAKPKKEAPVVVPEKEDEVIVMPKAPHNEPKSMSKSTTIWAALGTLVTSVTAILGNLNPIIQGLLIVLVAAFIFWIVKERMKGTNNLEGLF